MNDVSWSSLTKNSPEFEILVPLRVFSFSTLHDNNRQEYCYNNRCENRGLSSSPSFAAKPVATCAFWSKSGRSAQGPEWPDAFISIRRRPHLLITASSAGNSPKRRFTPATTVGKDVSTAGEPPHSLAIDSKRIFFLHLRQGAGRMCQHRPMNWCEELGHRIQRVYEHF